MSEERALRFPKTPEVSCSSETSKSNPANRIFYFIWFYHDIHALRTLGMSSDKVLLMSRLIMVAVLPSIQRKATNVLAWAPFLNWKSTLLRVFGFQHHVIRLIRGCWCAWRVVRCYSDPMVVLLVYASQRLCDKIPARPRSSSLVIFWRKDQRPL